MTKEEEKRRRKKGKRSTGVLLIIALFLLVAGLVRGCSQFFGKDGGEGEGSSSGSASTVSTASSVSTAESTEAVDADAQTSGEEVTYFDVSVSEDGYIHDSHQYTLDEIIEEMKALEGGFVVRIYDENAAQNLYSELTDRLKSEGIEYISAE